MFQIEQQSNLRPMIMAVLVGLLALGANHYRKLDMRVLEQLLQADRAETQTAEVALPGPPPAVETLLPKLPELEKRLSAAFTAWEQGKLAYNAPAFEPPLNALRPVAIQLREIAQTFQVEDQMTVLRLLFMAAQVRPSEFAQPFQSLCDWLEGNQDNRIGSQAGVLRFLQTYDLKRPDPDQLLPALDEFARRHVDPSCGVRLYSYVSKSLWSHGHATAAEDVLRAGINRFSGYGGTSKLVNQLVDQQQAPRR